MTTNNLSNELKNKLKRITIICGHYGTGKTNLAINIAAKLKASGDKVALVDLDIVNPYFISTDYKDTEALSGVKVVSPLFAGTNVDVPAISPEIIGVFTGDYNHVIIDAGGDDAGATALGRFSANIKNLGEYSLIYVINKYRALTTTAAEAAEILPQIETACRLKATGIINNSHLSAATEAEHILASIDFANETAALTGLELMYTTAPLRLVEALGNKVEKIMSLEIFVKAPWN